MDSTTLLAVLGPVIALGVQFLKDKVTIVGQYPKVAGAILALGISLTSVFLTGDLSLTITGLLQVALNAFVGTGTAVLSYEAVKATPAN